jgi:hypothetical protein
LVLSGWDLAEFVKFLPGTSTIRELFYLPVWSAGVVMAVLAFQPSSGLLKRLVLIAFALALFLAILPPYPHLLNGYRSAEFQWRFFLGIGGLLSVPGLLFASRRLAAPSPVLDRAVGGLLLTLALVGAIPALWQFLNARGAIEALYGTQPGWGWGLGAFLVGWVLIGTSGARTLVRPVPLRSA